MNYIVLDIETQNLVQDWDKPWEAGLACCCVWTSWDGRFLLFGPNDIERLNTSLSAWHVQQKARPVVTYNGESFDLRILVELGVTALKDQDDTNSVDMAAILLHKTGRRWSLEEVARHTLSRGKSGHGHQAPQMFAEGQFAHLHTYCMDDVALTRDLFEFARKHGYLVVGKDRIVNIRMRDCTAGPREVCEPPSKEPATQKQIEFLRRLHHPTLWVPTPGLTKHQAGQMIERLKNTGQVRP